MITYSCWNILVFYFVLYISVTCRIDNVITNECDVMHNVWCAFVPEITSQVTVALGVHLGMLFIS